MGDEIESAIELQHLESQHLVPNSQSWADIMYTRLGSDTDSPIPPQAVKMVRDIIIKHCGEGVEPDWSTAERTSFDVRLLEAWRSSAKDPDYAVTRWLAGWAPAGIVQQAEPCGISPEITEPAEMHISDLQGNIEDFNNYAGVDENPTATDEIELRLLQGHLKAFDTAIELEQFVGATKELPAILSKIGIITKMRAGKTKHRMILDTKAAFIKYVSRKGQRVILPRLLDAILQALRLMGDCKTGEGVEWLVLDFTDAFWQIRLHPDERIFSVAALSTKANINLFPS